MEFKSVIEDIYLRKYHQYVAMAFRELRPMGPRAVDMVAEVVQEAFSRIIASGPRDGMYETYPVYDNTDWYSVLDDRWESGADKPPRLERRIDSERVEQYIGGILKNVACDFMRKARVAENQPLPANADLIPESPSDASAKTEQRDIFERAWTHLDSATQQLLRDRYEGELTLKAIAGRLGCVESTVSERLKVAVNKLRRAIVSCSKDRRP